MALETLYFFLDSLGISRNIFLAYLPIPFFLTALYSVLVYRAQSQLAYRIRAKFLRLIVWFNIFGLPAVFVIGGLLFRDVFFVSTGTDPLLPLFRSLQLGMIFGALSTTPILLLLLRGSQELESGTA